MCKQRAVSVCPTSERWAAEPSTCAQLFSPCCQWASPGWGPSQRPVTGRPAHGLTSGLRRRVGSFPFCFSFFSFVLLPLFLYHSIYLCLCFLTPALSSSCLPLSFHGGVRGSRSQGKGMMNSSASRASWLFSSRTVTSFPSSSPLPRFYYSFSSLHLSPHSKPGRTIEWGELRDALTRSASEVSRDERWHITTTFRSLISYGCHGVLISWMKNTLCTAQEYGALCFWDANVSIPSYPIKIRAPSSRS